MLYFSFDTVFTLVLREGNVQRYFDTLVAGQVGVFFNAIRSKIYHHNPSQLSFTNVHVI